MERGREQEKHWRRKGALASDARPRHERKGRLVLGLCRVTAGGDEISRPSRQLMAKTGRTRTKPLSHSLILESHGGRRARKEDPAVK